MTVLSHDAVIQTCNTIGAENITAYITAYNNAHHYSGRKKILFAMLKFVIICQMYSCFDIRKLVSYWTIPKAILLVKKIFPNIVSNVQWC